MQEMFLPRADWVLSGSVVGWGNELISHFDLVVFVQTPRELRLQRLRNREAAHFGADAVAPGGWRHDETESFVEWASHYEDGTREGRNLSKHETWLAACPVLCCGSMGHARPRLTSRRSYARSIAEAAGPHLPSRSTLLRSRSFISLILGSGADCPVVSVRVAGGAAFGTEL